MSWRSGLALLLVSSLFWHAAPCFAEDTGSAGDNHQAALDAHRHALSLFDHGEHARALVEFRRAYALSPSFRILYNVGLSCVALGDSRGALEAFAMYLRDGAERIPEHRRTQVEAEIARLSKLLAGLSVDVQEPGAELSVDDEVLGTAPLSRQIRLNAGRHTVQVRSPDGTLKTQSITLQPGDESQLRFGAAGSPVRTTGTSRTEDSLGAPSAAPAKRSVPWVAWGVTGALGATTAVTGVLALGARADERDAQRRRGVQAKELVAARDKVEGLALATDVLLAGTLLSAGVSLYLTLRPAHGAEARTALVVTPGWVTLRRSF